MTRQVLVVDANEAFATMLSMGLQEVGGLQIETASSGGAAAQAIASGAYDLVIVDMGLPDVQSAHLLRTLRQEYPSLRLAVIPLDGNEIPAELAGLNLQGALSKPFFFPELPGWIEQVFAHPMGDEPAPVREEPPPPPSPSPMVSSPPPVRGVSLSADQQARLIQIMGQLAQDVGADAVLLTEYSTLLAHAGVLPEERVTPLLELVSEFWQTATRLAQVLGKEARRFEQSIQGPEHLLYSLALSETLVLSVVVTGRAPLGMIRHRTRETAEMMRGLVAM